MIFVTGATGMLGSHVLLRLAQESKPFRAFKRDSSSLDLCKRIFSYYKAEALFSKINWVEGNVNDISSLEEGMKNCDFLLHCAGVVSFLKSDLEMLKKTNIEGTSNVMNVALASGIKKAGYVSSIAALGRNSTNEVVDEE